jgi:formamidopyrimidine-DNA glycosylase
MEGARFVEVIANRPDLRGPLPKRFAARLEGSVVRELGRRGKYLVAELTSGDVLLMHLGMSGSFRIETGAPGSSGLESSGNAIVAAETYYMRPQASAHDHIVFRMSSGAVVTFNDPRRFGSMDLLTSAALAAHRVGALGPEPLDEAFTAAQLAATCRRRKTTLKAALMDQRVVAGLGNIYVCEALHLARLSPRRRASTIATAKGAPTPAARELVKAIKAVMTRAIDLQSRTPADEDPDDRFRVYGREGLACRRRGCKGVIKRIVQAGRSTFFCPVCQR